MCVDRSCSHLCFSFAFRLVHFKGLEDLPATFGKSWSFRIETCTLYSAWNLLLYILLYIPSRVQNPTSIHDTRPPIYNFAPLGSRSQSLNLRKKRIASGFDTVLLASTSLPLIVCFTAASTFFPLIVVGISGTKKKTPHQRCRPGHRFFLCGLPSTKNLGT